MEPTKLCESELKIMDIVWANEPISAKEVSVLAAETIEWNKNTTYTIISKLVEKQCLLRREPNFICTSLVDKEAVQKAETNSLIDKLYNGSKKAFFAAFLNSEDLTDQELAEIKKLIENR